MRIAVAVHCCRECPNRQYDSGGVYECVKVRAPLVDSSNIPQWCPLPHDNTLMAARAERMLHDAKQVLGKATQEAADTSTSPERLRDLLRIAADQLARYS